MENPNRNSEQHPNASCIPALIRDKRGAVLVEAAFALPIMLVLLMASVSYGFWMLTAQSLQQVANDAARASVGGLGPTERAALARQSVKGSLLSAASLDPKLVTVSIKEEDSYFTIRLSYDGSNDPVFNTAIIPLPDTTVSRAATVRVAGYAGGAS